MLDGKLTISRVDTNRGETYMSIQIDDKTSGTTVIECKLTPENFMLALSGFGAQPLQYAIAEHMENIGKKKIIDYVDIHLDVPYLSISEKDTSDAITEYINKHVPEGWQLWNDGFNTRQHTSGVHRITICKYE